MRGFYVLGRQALPVLQLCAKDKAAQHEEQKTAADGSDCKKNLAILD